MSLTFILSVLFDHLFILWNNTNTSVCVTTQSRSLIYSLGLFLRGSLCFPLCLFSSSVFLPFVLSSFGRHRSPRGEKDVIDLEMN